MILHNLGYQTPSQNLPYCLVYYLAFITASLMTLLTQLLPIKLPNPTFTPLKVALAGTHHYYSCQRAKKELGYYPLYSMHEAIQATTEAFAHLRNVETKELSS
jgi:sterol-4alpha-carboxylate 3-dehydrogenase (decarboxylating)